MEDIGFGQRIESVGKLGAIPFYGLFWMAHLCHADLILNPKIQAKNVLQEHGKDFTFVPSPTKVCQHLSTQRG